MTTKKELAQQLDDIRKRLSIAGSKESSFITVELLFYDAITIARSIEDDPQCKELLNSLKQLESTYYKNTKELFRKTNQKEVVIRKFIVQFKNTLNAGIKSFLATPPKTTSATSKV